MLCQPGVVQTLPSRSSWWCTLQHYQCGTAQPQAGACCRLAGVTRGIAYRQHALQQHRLCSRWRCPCSGRQGAKRGKIHSSQSDAAGSNNEGEESTRERSAQGTSSSADQAAGPGSGPGQARRRDPAATFELIDLLTGAASADDSTPAAPSSSPAADAASQPAPASPRPPAQQQGGPAAAGQQAPEEEGDGSSRKLRGADSASLQLPPAVIQRLRTSVFGFDTLWVTSVENYQADGVLFKGNLRGRSPAEAYDKMAARLKDQLGEGYELFLLEDQASQPTAVILPAAAVAEPAPPVPEPAVAALFALATLAACANAAGLPLFDTERWAEVSPAAAGEALAAAAPFLALLAAHEAGHRVAAARRGVRLSLPFLLPSGLGLLGSFGAITRIRGIVRDRATLLEVAAAGPLAGAAASLAMAVAGLALAAGGMGGLEAEPSAFQDTFLMGALGQLILGDQMAGGEVALNPLLLGGWAGLIFNALNAIPVGELDGGRIALALFGRRGAQRINVVTLLLLGLGGIANQLALYWLLVVLFLQRGPIAPGRDELTPPASGAARAAGALALALPLLALLPYPFALGPPPGL